MAAWSTETAPKLTVTLSPPPPAQNLARPPPGPPCLQLRRQTRLRREFLYSKSLENKERQIWERKQRVKDLLAKGKSVPKGQGVGDRELRMDGDSAGEQQARSLHTAAILR